MRCLSRAHLFCLPLLALLAPACGSATATDPTSLADMMGPPLPPPPDPTTCKGPPYPIVLSHGMAGFETIGPLNYFYNVKSDLAARGETVIESQVPPYDSSTVRGAKLAQVIEDTLHSSSACKVNLIAHSQGGIDSRYVISTLHYGDRIASLVTIGTPHLGTVVADVGLGLVAGPQITATLINGVLLGIQGLTSNRSGSPDISANLMQLSTGQMAQFNTQNSDDPRVTYYSVAGRSSLAAATSECQGGLWPNPSGLDILNPLLTVPASVFPLLSPSPLSPIPSDGLVAVASARWGHFLGCVPADHFDEVGQVAESGPDLVSGFYHRDLYRQLVSKLHSDGL